jgi:RNA polymerase sigma-70 factor (ECF subfamily)
VKAGNPGFFLYLTNLFQKLLKKPLISCNLSRLPKLSRQNHDKEPNRLTTLTDNSLMLRVKAGDLDKMGLLFERYNRPLFAFFYHMTHKADWSEDLVQNVFYRMLKYKHTFTGEGEFRSWMYYLARNVLNDAVRQNKGKNHLDVQEVADQLDGGMLADEALEKQQDKDFLHRAMESLSAEYREILILSRFQELKYDEIAKVLNINEGTVKVRVHRALGELKKKFFTNEKR